MISSTQLNVYLQKLWAKHGCDYFRDRRPGISISELVELSEQRNRELDLPSLDLWIAIFDEYISWQISLLTVFYGRRKVPALSTNFDKSVTMLLMKTIGDSLALRHLILLGFDTAAKTLLRSTAEYMELLVAILSDPSLADEFSNTDTPARAKQFWEKQLRSKLIRQKLKAAWRKHFPNNEYRETVDWFADWGSTSNAVLSALVHPSFAGGMFTAVPLKQSYDDDDDWLGIWGSKADSSVDTIAMYGSFMFPLLFLNSGFPFEDFDEYMTEGNIKYNKDNSLHAHVKVGRSVLASLILSLNDEKNNSLVFPEIDFSIWEEDSPDEA